METAYNKTKEINKQKINCAENENLILRMFEYNPLKIEWNECDFWLF